MSTGWRKPVAAFWVRARDLALTLLIMGTGEVLIALVVWPLLFDKYPQGFSMALSLVGFSVWVIASVASLSNRGRPRFRSSATPGELSSSPSQLRLGRLPRQLQPGCGFPFFLSSFVPLTLAFILRVRADLQAGYTWHDLFPPLR
jgi:hypothetical protein